MNEKNESIKTKDNKFVNLNISIRSPKGLNNYHEFDIKESGKRIQ
jgi:hypothetical protein